MISLNDIITQENCHTYKERRKEEFKRNKDIIREHLVPGCNFNDDLIPILTLFTLNENENNFHYNKEIINEMFHLLTETIKELKRKATSYKKRKKNHYYNNNNNIISNFHIWMNLLFDDFECNNCGHCFSSDFVHVTINFRNGRFDHFHRQIYGLQCKECENMEYIQPDFEMGDQYNYTNLSYYDKIKEIIVLKLLAGRRKGKKSYDRKHNHLKEFCSACHLGLH